jgi:hypothetical protein
MAEEPQVATEGAPVSTESATENQGVSQNVSEDATTPGKSAEEKYQESLVALRADRSKLKAKNAELEEVKARLAQLEATTAEEDEDEPSEPKRRGNTSKALAELAIKISTEPGFKDRLDLVQEKMESGMTLEQADNAVLANIVRKMMTASESAPQQSPPKSINTTAIPEPSAQKRTGNILDDAVGGKLNIPPEMAQTLARVRKTNTGWGS